MIMSFLIRVNGQTLETVVQGYVSVEARCAVLEQALAATRHYGCRYALLDHRGMSETNTIADQRQFRTYLDARQIVWPWSRVALLRSAYFPASTGFVDYLSALGVDARCFLSVSEAKEWLYRDAPHESSGSPSAANQSGFQTSSQAWPSGSTKVPA